MFFFIFFMNFPCFWEFHQHFWNDCQDCWIRDLPESWQKFQKLPIWNLGHLFGILWIFGIYIEILGARAVNFRTRIEIVGFSFSLGLLSKFLECLGFFGICVDIFEFPSKFSDGCQTGLRVLTRFLWFRRYSEDFFFEFFK